MSKHKAFRTPSSGDFAIYWHGLNVYQTNQHTVLLSRHRTCESVTAQTGNCMQETCPSAKIESTSQTRKANKKQAVGFWMGCLIGIPARCDKGKRRDIAQLWIQAVEQLTWCGGCRCLMHSLALISAVTG